MNLKWFDALSKSNESSEFDESIDRDLQDTAPVIDWQRTSAKDRKDNGLNVTTRSDKLHRNSKWVAGFVGGRDDKVDKGKLEALNITLSASISPKRR